MEVEGKVDNTSDDRTTSGNSLDPASYVDDLNFDDPESWKRLLLDKSLLLDECQSDPPKSPPKSPPLAALEPVPSPLLKPIDDCDSDDSDTPLYIETVQAGASTLQETQETLPQASLLGQESSMHDRPVPNAVEKNSRPLNLPNVSSTSVPKVTSPQLIRPLTGLSEKVAAIGKYSTNVVFLSPPARQLKRRETEKVENNSRQQKMSLRMRKNRESALLSRQRRMLLMKTQEYEIKLLRQENRTLKEEIQRLKLANKCLQANV